MRTIIWILIAVKNKYLILLAVLKFATTQNEPKRAERKKCNPQPATTIHDQFFLTVSIIRQVLTIPLLTEEPFFTWTFRRWVPIFKYLQEFKVAYRWKQLERLIFDYTPIVVGSWKIRFKTLEFKCLWNQGGCSP